jgi:hypothetical protein
MNIIKKFYVKQMVKKIDSSIKVKFGKCLECEPTENTIYVNNKTNKIDIITFYDYVKELNNKCNFNSLLLGILHEIGHIYTFNEHDEEEYTRDTELLSLLYQDNKLTDKQINEFYVRLPLESNATKWAIDFAMQNKKFCRYYQNKIGKEIAK